MNKNEEGKLFEKELDSIKTEKDKIRKILDAAGVKNPGRIDKLINIFFILFAITFFLLDILKHIYKFQLPYISIDSLLTMVILIACIKILINIHIQAKVNHFQFWVLNSLEFRLNDISKKLNDIEKNTHK
jgi:hypothetical protein